MLASIAIGAEAFAPGKTSPRRPAESVSQTQEEDSDGSDNVKGYERPADDSGSLGVPSEEEGKFGVFFFHNLSVCVNEMIPR